jgi:hypothetical protein
VCAPLRVKRLLCGSKAWGSCNIGTYHVDPDLPVPDSCLLKSSNKSRKHKLKNLPPNATFKSKSGSIDLNLVITGRPDGTGVSKARVNLTSRSGDIAVNLVRCGSDELKVVLKKCYSLR